MLLLKEKNLNIDLSQLRGFRFKCLESCQLCCLCQPELLQEEVEYFLKHYGDAVCFKKRPHQHYAIKLKQNQGPCVFLVDRKCMVYDSRPHFCRQFPIHFHVLDRIQAELDLSCRGIWDNRGDDLEVLASQLIYDKIEAFTETLKESRKLYSEFISECRGAGLWKDPGDLRIQVNQSLEKFLDLRFLARVLELSVEDDELNLGEIKNEESLKIESVDIVKVAMKATLDSISVSKIVDAPVYCDDEGYWNVFMTKGSKINWCRILDDGSIEHIETIDPNSVELLVPDQNGRRLLSKYLMMLNERDSVLGYACYLVDSFEYEDFLSNVYFGVIGTSILDLLWRGSLLAFLKGRKLDETSVKEAIIFFDMDLLDAPTIGAFV
jgi:Fe-S-cluster containining protein